MMDMETNNPTLKKLEAIQAQVRRMGEITRKMMCITTYETVGYLDGKILDINRASGHRSVSEESGYGEKNTGS